MKRILLSILALLACSGLLFAQSSGQSGSSDQGLVVANVAADSPAAKAGIVPGDILLQLDGKAVNTARDVAEILAAHSGGDTVSAVVLHGGKQQTLSITLETRLMRPALGVAFMAQSAGKGPGGTAEGGGRTRGAFVQVVEPNSPASAVGVQQGDLIIGVDGSPLLRGTTLTSLVNAHKPGDQLTLSILRQGLQTPVSVQVTLGAAGGQPYLGVQYAMVSGERSQGTSQSQGRGYDRFHPFSLGPGSLSSPPQSGLSVPQGLTF